MGNWNHISNWYDSIVQEKGHYYHENVIIPKVLKLIQNKKSVLDLACGQGILQRSISKDAIYMGVDISAHLIKRASEYNRNKNHRFLVKDICQNFLLDKKDFDVATLILAIQDLENPTIALNNAYQHLRKDGQLIIVMNHPCFRIPRQSSWEIDENRKMMYRRVNLYMSELKIPIDIAPSKKERSEKIFAHHFPLSILSKYLYENKFVIEKMEEWVSDKVSTGSKSKMENRARDEFPLFFTIVAKK